MKSLIKTIFALAALVALFVLPLHLLATTVGL